MISHRYKCVFIHQRKTAGMSILRSFGFTQKSRRWNLKQGVYRPGSLFNDGTSSPEWVTRERIAAGYAVFTVIRNPWDRFVSGWKYLPQYKHLPLADVLASLPKDGHDYRHLTRPQCRILIDSRGEFIADYVLRFENLEEDYRRFCAIIGKKDDSLGVTNTTGHQPYRTYYDDATREAVRDLFKEDINRFGYDFESGARPLGALKGKLLGADTP